MPQLLRRFLLATCLTLLPVLVAMPLQAQEQVDPATGFIQQPGWELVQTTCTTCHSSQLIVQNSGSRDVWLSRIRWMQDTQGLQQLTPAVEDSILTYLSSSYGPKPATRRAGLAPHLLPAAPDAQ